MLIHKNPSSRGLQLVVEDVQWRQHLALPVRLWQDCALGVLHFPDKAF